MVCLVVAVLTLGETPISALPPEPTSARRLAVSGPITDQLHAGAVLAFELNLDPERRYRVDVDQMGIDVAVSAWPVNGASAAVDTALTVDAPIFRRGMERLLLPAGSTGRWRLEVRAPSAVAPGWIRARLVDVSGSSSRRLQADTAWTEGARLARDGTGESRQEAIQRFEETRAIWHELGDVQGEAWSLLALGVLDVAAGDPRSAFDASERALPRFDSLGDRAGVAVCLNEMGLAQWRLGDTDRAENLLRRALELNRELGERFGEAMALNNLALLSHSRGNLVDARSGYLRVLELLHESDELAQEALILNNLGSADNDLGEPQSALDHFHNALALQRSTHDHNAEARTLNNIAVVHRRLGNMQEALDHYLKALDVLQVMGERFRQAPILRNIGSAYLSLGEPNRALPYAERSLALARETGDRRGEAAALRCLGQAKADLEQADEAQQAFRRALELFRDMRDRRSQATVLDRMAEGLLKQGKAEEGLAQLERALSSLEDTHDLSTRSLILQHLGAASLDLGDLDTARSRLEEAKTLRQQTSNLRGEIETLVTLAKVARRAKRPDRAFQLTEEALDRVESLRSRIGSPELRATYLATQRTAYELAVELLLERREADVRGRFVEQARAMAERSRARSLLDMFGEARATAGVSPELARRRTELLERLDTKVSRRLELLSRGSAEKVAQLGIEQVVTELDQVEHAIRLENPQYMDLTSPPILDLQATQALLASQSPEDDTLLLEYFLAEERSFLWVIDARDVSLFSLPGRELIETLAGQTAREFRAVDPGAGPYEHLAPAQLGEIVLGPVAHRLRGQRMVVVADGALSIVPFGALPLPSMSNHGTPDPVVLHHEVVEIPSVSALAAFRRVGAARRMAAQTLAVLADPVFSRHDERFPDTDPIGREGAAAASPSRGADKESLLLERLFSSRAEAEAIAGLVAPADRLIALGVDANRSLVLGGALQNFVILHFATHGTIDTGSPQFSGLMLSRFDAQGRPVEGFLGLREIYGLDLQADLVVLSGCETALGRHVAGEGLVGLTHGFQVAGASRVISSLWRVEDRATAELMTAFYRELFEGGLSPAAALRSAQLAIRSDPRWRAPYYWAGFVLQGDWIRLGW